MGDLCNFDHRKFVNNNFFKVRELCLRAFVSVPFLQPFPKASLARNFSRVLWAFGNVFHLYQDIPLSVSNFASFYCSIFEGKRNIGIEIELQNLLPKTRQQELTRSLVVVGIAWIVRSPQLYIQVVKIRIMWLLVMITQCLLVFLQGQCW